MEVSTQISLQLITVYVDLHVMIEGKKLFMDHNMTSIQDYIDSKTLQKYDAIDVNVYQSNIFHTKLLIKEINLQNYLVQYGCV